MAKVVITGITKAMNAGEYIAYATPTKECCWEDGTTGTRELKWRIDPGIVSLPTQKGFLVYNGNQQSPVWNSYDTNALVISGETTATEPGYHTVTFTPNENATWSDGTRTPKNVDWFMAKEMLSAPAQTNTLTYNGGSLQPTWNSNYNASRMNISGDTYATNAGGYSSTFTLKDTTENTYVVFTNGERSIRASWIINRQPISYPSLASGTFSYDGRSKAPTFNNYVAAKMNISGEQNAVNAGTHTTYFTPGNNFCWSNGSTGAYGVNWMINRASVSVPSLVVTNYTTSGEEIAPNFNYNASLVNIGGTYKTAAAGTHTATFTLKDGNNYQWSDGSTGQKTIRWTVTIQKVKVALPTLYGSEYEYTGRTISPNFGYNSTYVVISGNTSAVAMGSYTATFRLKDTNYQEWSDGTSGQKTITWRIVAPCDDCWDCDDCDDCSDCSDCSDCKDCTDCNDTCRWDCDDCDCDCDCDCDHCNDCSDCQDCNDNPCDCDCDCDCDHCNDCSDCQDCNDNPCDCDCDCDCDCGDCMEQDGDCDCDCDCDGE